MSFAGIGLSGLQQILGIMDVRVFASITNILPRGILIYSLQIDYSSKSGPSTTRYIQSAEVGSLHMANYQ